MGIDRNDLRKERQTDEKVGVAKDIKRISRGDVSGTLKDDYEEMKADVKAVDDKVEKAFKSDDRDDRDLGSGSDRKRDY